MPQDVIFYYAKVLPKLRKFLKGREIATKIKLKNYDIIKRGSDREPLYIEQLIKGLDKTFLSLRKEDVHLKDIKTQLTKTQVKIWDYFVPRKLIECHYAVNREHPQRPLQRILFDIDRKDVPAEKAQIVASYLIEKIQKDKTFPIPYKIFPLWTGNSFHVYLLLKKIVSHDFYERYIHIDPIHEEKSFTGRWIAQINKTLKGIEVSASHEKKRGVITIDPSLSPSGKLARAPFSLYVTSYSSSKGIALPITREELNEKDLVKELRSYTTEKVIKKISTFAKRIP